MDTIRFNNKIHNIVAIIIIAIFFSNTALSANIVNEAYYTSKITKLIFEAREYAKKNDEAGLIRKALQIKEQVEAATGNKIDLNKMIDKAAVDCRKAGAPISHQHIEAYKRKFRAQEKKSSKKKSGWFFQPPCLSKDFSSLSKHHQKKEKEEKKEVSVPIRISMGITLVLAGGFLAILPIPICKRAGATLFMMGVESIREGYIQLEEKKEEKRS